MRRRKAILLAAAAVAVLTVLAWKPLARALLEGLSVEDALERADAVVVVAGGALERRATAVEIVRAGFAPRILVSGVRESELSYERERLPAGTPVEALPPIEASFGYGGTFVEVRGLLAALRERGVARALLVTSATHTRRVRYVVGRVRLEGDPEILLVAAPNLDRDLDRWWRTREGWDTVAGEWVKLLLYKIAY